jgi:hypothetical protein
MDSALFQRYFSYTRPLPVMREIAKTIEHRAKNANAQTAHLFFAEHFIQRLKK